MRCLVSTGVVAFGLMSAGVMDAQFLEGTAVPPPPNPPGVYTQFPFAGVSVPSAGGGAKEQPYTLTERVTTERVLVDGTTIRQVDEVIRMRDSEGRTRTEMARVKDGVRTAYRIDIVDPVEHLAMCLTPKYKIGDISRWAEPAGSKKSPWVDSDDDPRQTSGVEKREVEALPYRTIAGVKATGQRTVFVLPVDTMGNDRELRTVTEIWTSPELGIELARTVDSPLTGRCTAVVTKLKRGEPDAAMFRVPEGYAMKDKRKPVTATP